MFCSKYEEMSAPQVEDFCYITANTYAREEVSVQSYDILALFFSPKSNTNEGL